MGHGTAADADTPAGLRLIQEGEARLTESETS